MRQNITISALIGGTSLFALCFMGMMTKAGAFVYLISHFLPGLILGFLLTQHSVYEVPAKNKTFFVIASTAIYIACVFFVNIAHDDKVVTPVKLIISSTVGAVLLTLLYDLLFFRKLGFIHTFLFPMLFGALASLLSAFCLYYLHYVSFEQKVLETLLWAGVFSIFPCWHYLITFNIEANEKAADNTSFPK